MGTEFNFNYTARGRVYPQLSPTPPLRGWCNNIIYIHKINRMLGTLWLVCCRICIRLCKHNDITVIALCYVITDSKENLLRLHFCRATVLAYIINVKGLHSKLGEGPALETLEFTIQLSAVYTNLFIIRHTYIIWCKHLRSWVHTIALKFSQTLQVFASDYVCKSKCKINYGNMENSFYFLNCI